MGIDTVIDYRFHCSKMNGERKRIIMDWFTKLWKSSISTYERTVLEVPKVERIDVMRDDTNPSEITIENAYKTRWIWYHTILAIGIFMTNMLLIAILTLLAIKL